METPDYKLITQPDELGPGAPPLRGAVGGVGGLVQVVGVHQARGVVVRVLADRAEEGRFVG